MTGPIGVFDSGYGGLTVLKELVKKLPQYDFIYLGDNARAPYGNRSFETVYEYTLSCVKALFNQGCPLVILACNTASAKALRTIQQIDLKNIAPSNRVLGVIRPTAETIGIYSESKHVGIFATEGTVNSKSYILEINKFFPDITVLQEACPMWVPLVENQELDNEGANYFIQKHVQSLFTKSEKIDTILLGCTHYPLLQNAIEKHVPDTVKIISQGQIVADSLQDYLSRHPDMESRISCKAERTFYTTDDENIFNKRAEFFYGSTIQAAHLHV